MCHRTTTSYLDNYGQRQTQDEYKLCPNANGRPCSLVTTGNSRELEERIPDTAVTKYRAPVDVHYSSGSNESKGKSKGSSFNAVEVEFGLRKPSFRLVDTNKERKESHRSKGEKSYSSRDNYGMPAYLPSQIPPAAPDAPAPGTYYRLPTYPMPSPAGPPTMAPPSVYPSSRSGDSGYVTTPVSALSSRAVVFVEPTTQHHRSEHTTPPHDNVRLVVPSSSSSRPSTSTSRTNSSELFSPPASVNSSKTYYSNVANPGLSRHHTVSKGTNPHAYRDSALGTSIGTPSSPTTTTVGGVHIVTRSENAGSVRASESSDYFPTNERDGPRGQEREKRHRSDTSSNNEGHTRHRHRRSHRRDDEQNDESSRNQPPPPPPHPPAPFNNSASNYYDSSYRHVEGTERHRRDSSREPRPRHRRHHHTSSSSTSSSPSPVTVSRRGPRGDGPRGDGPSGSGSAAVVMSGALPGYSIHRRTERKSPSVLGDMDEIASTTDRRTREARRRFKEDEMRSVMHN